MPVLLLVCCPCVRTGAADAGSIGSGTEWNKITEERMKDMKFTHKENEIVLLAEDGKLLAQITFPYTGEDKSSVDINHTFVDASLRGQGVAGKLMKELVQELEERDVKAVPTCSYAAGWFEKHPEYSHLLK